MLQRNTTIDDLLKFYMGKNTPTRQEFIINNLKVEDNSQIENKDGRE